MTYESKDIGHIISHTHWDREWRVPVWNSRWRLIKMMDQLLAALSRSPEFVFLFDGQVVSIEDYLDACPDREKEVKDYIRQGRLQIGPWYNLPDLYPVCGEALIRNLLVGNRTAQKLGKCLNLAYTTFGWGQTAQFPQIFRGFDINFAVCGKNVDRTRAPNSEFIWRSPDGSEILTTRLGIEKRANFFFFVVMPARYGTDYWSDETRIKWGQDGWIWHNANGRVDAEAVCLEYAGYHPETLKESVEKAWIATEDTLVKQHRFMGNGCDSTAPDDIVDAVIDEANALFTDRELKHSSIETYAELVQKRINDGHIKLKTVCGELRDGPVHSLSANALATRMYLKTLNRAAQDGVIRYAEAFATLAGMFGMEYPAFFLNKAWHYLLLAHSHDALNGVTLDKTAEDTAYKLKQAIELSQVVTDMVAVDILKKVDLSGSEKDILIAVFNPSSQPQRQIVHATIDVPSEIGCRWLGMEDNDGKSLGCQPIACRAHQAPVCVENSRALPFYADRHTMYVDTGVIPSYGFKIIKAVPCGKYRNNVEFWHGTYEFGTQLTGPNRMANTYLEVQINSDGTFDLLCKASGRTYKGMNYFEDSGEVGDYWQRVKPSHDQVYYSTGLPCEIYLKHDGPLVTSFCCDLKMNIPAHAVKRDRFDTHRSRQKAVIDIHTELTLRADTPYVEITTTVDNHAKDHRLRVCLPTGIRAETSDAQGHFNIDRRQVSREYRDGVRDGEMSTLPMQNFVDISDGKNGLAVLNKNLIEFEVSEDATGTIHCTLLRCMETRICTEQRCATTEKGDVGSQCLGQSTFSYAVYPHDGTYTDANIYTVMEKYLYTPKLYQVSGHDKGALDRCMSFIAIDNPNLQVSAIKPAEDREGIVFRIYNPFDNAASGSIDFAREVRCAWMTNMNEKKQCPLSVEKGRLKVDVKPCQIMTIVCEF